jgi:hypothetical protein
VTGLFWDSNARAKPGLPLYGQFAQFHRRTKFTEGYDMAKKHRITEPVVSVVASDDRSSQQIPFKRESFESPSFVSLYANDINIQTGPWDVRLLLGEVRTVPTQETPIMKVKEIGEVRISPQMAKQLTILLIEQLQVYESQFGPIPAPPK